MRPLRLPLPSTSQTDSRPARMYPLFFRFFLSRLDAERAHHLAVTVIQAIPRLRMVGVVRRLTRPHPSLATTALGLRFDSPFGVAAGFDTNATMVRGLWSLGPESGGRALASAQAPDLVLPSLSGEPFPLSRLRGTKVLIAAWASW